MSKLKHLMLTASVLYVCTACAEIQHFQQDYESSFSVEDEFVCVVAKPLHNNSKLIKDAALAAGAAYNDSHLVEVSSRANRYQNGVAARKLLAVDNEIVNFSGQANAGLISCNIDSNGKLKLTIAFHGTESEADLKTDLDGFKIYGSQLGINGWVHGGFYKRYMESRESINDVIVSVLCAYGKEAKDVDFVITGHILGGALATLAAIDVKNNVAKDADIKLVTFSSPRVVDNAGAEHIERLLGSNSILRIWRENDPISMVSIGSKLLWGYYSGFKHVGEGIKLKARSNSWADFLSLENHKHDYHMADASSPEPVVILKHEGKRDFIARKVSTVIKSLKKASAFVPNLFKKTLNSFGSNKQ